MKIQRKRDYKNSEPDSIDEFNIPGVNRQITELNKFSNHKMSESTLKNGPIESTQSTVDKTIDENHEINIDHNALKEDDININ